MATSPVSRFGLPRYASLAKTILRGLWGAASAWQRRRGAPGASASQCWGVGVSVLGRRRLSAEASASQRRGVGVSASGRGRLGVAWAPRRRGAGASASGRGRLGVGAWAPRRRGVCASASGRRRRGVGASASRRGVPQGTWQRRWLRKGGVRKHWARKCEKEASREKVVDRSSVVLVMSLCRVILPRTLNYEGLLLVELACRAQLVRKTNRWLLVG